MADATMPSRVCDVFLASGDHQPVVELYGEEGSGKTQCLHHLLANFILPNQWNGVEVGGGNTGVVYFDNDYHLNMLRLTAIMEQRITVAFDKDLPPPSDELLDVIIKQCLRNLYVIRCSSSSQMIITLQSLDGMLKNKANVSVLIIDSISAYYWIDRSGGGENIALQEENLNKVSQAIGELKEANNLTVFATKSAIFVRKSKDEPEKALDHCEYLCKQWQKLVTSRWIFSKLPTLNTFYLKADKQKASAKFGSKFVITEAGLSFVK